MRSAVASLMLALPCFAAAAGPLTIGAGVGQTANQDGTIPVDNQDCQTLGAFGRLGVARRLAVQLAIGRTEMDHSLETMRTFDGALVLDLGDRPLVPLVIGDAGLDSLSARSMDLAQAHHFEAGLGLEYRTEGGFLIGADARIGTRTIDSQKPMLSDIVIASPLQAGQYRAVRAFIGVRL
jgi:hypothetical protein